LSALAGIRDAINRAGDNRGVSASIINDADGSRLVLSGRETGKANTIEVAVTNAGGDLGQLARESLSVITAAADAEVRIDGFTITNATNRIDKAIDGITLELKAVTPDEETDALRVTEDRAAMLGRVRSFVERYNGLVDILKGLANGCSAGTPTFARRSAPRETHLVGPRRSPGRSLRDTGARCGTPTLSNPAALQDRSRGGLRDGQHLQRYHCAGDRPQPGSAGRRGHPPTRCVFQCRRSGIDVHGVALV